MVNSGQANLSEIEGHFYENVFFEIRPESDKNMAIIRDTLGQKDIELELLAFWKARNNIYIYMNFGCLCDRVSVKFIIDPNFKF